MTFGLVMEHSQSKKSIIGETAGRYHESFFAGIFSLHHFDQNEIDPILDIDTNIAWCLESLSAWGFQRCHLFFWLQKLMPSLTQTHSLFFCQRNPLINKLEDAHFSYFVRASQDASLGEFRRRDGFLGVQYGWCWSEGSCISGNPSKKWFPLHDQVGDTLWFLI